MKKLLIGIFFLGLTNLAFAQVSSEEGRTLELEGITVMPPNMGYFTNVVNGGVKAIKVVELQKIVASFDIAKSSIYDAKVRLYDFKFKHKDGNVSATFNRDGRIVKSYERYKDIAFPVTVRNSIYKAFPGWSTEANTYIVSYASGHNSKKVLKVKLAKEGKTKHIKVNTQGKIL